MVVFLGEGGGGSVEGFNGKNQLDGEQGPKSALSLTDNYGWSLTSSEVAATLPARYCTQMKSATVCAAPCSAKKTDKKSESVEQMNLITFVVQYLCMSLKT